MTSERWQQVERIYHSVLDVEPGRRATALTEACAGDEELREEVESLLALEDQAEEFIQTSAIRLAAEALAADTLAAEPADSSVGRRIGPYQLAEQIAQGGMGAVYRAVRVDDQYQKQVAVKLVKRGMETDLIVRHFHRERQILAVLEHPYIARLLDGGTTEDNCPYFVMEYVEGQPLIQYCDSRKLSTVGRLELFRKVCEAVQYAHQRLIVHRDIKPGNILVTDEGVPKLLDFGIAKILSSAQAEATMTSQRLMTPEYASPEQVRGDPVTTASDVYALGVVLYELLTGHRPYRLKARTQGELAQVICQTDPEKPSTAIARVEQVSGPDGSCTVLTPESVSSTREGRPEKLRRRLAGDLDNIVLKTLRKEPERRYASVEQLSEDIHRHLKRMPVIARKDTVRYRSLKFIHRHKLGVGAATLVALSLLGGAGVATWQARVAQKRFQDVRKLANSVVFELHDAIKDLPGSTPARVLLVSRALQYLDDLARSAQRDASLQRELAAAYEKLGDVQGGMGHSNIGDPVGALASFRKALALRETLAAKAPKDLESRRALAGAFGNVGLIFESRGESAAALENYQKARAIREALCAVAPANIRFSRDLAISYHQVAGIFQTKGDWVAALEYRNKALFWFESVAKSNPKDIAARGNLALAHKKLGALLIDTKGPDALEHYQAAAAIEEALCAENPLNADAQMNLSYTYSDIGTFLLGTGERGAGIRSYRQSLAIREAIAAADPQNHRARSALAGIQLRLGWALADDGDTAGALKSLHQALSILKSITEGHGASEENYSQLCHAYANLGYAHRKIASAPKASKAKQIENWLRAREYYRQALESLSHLRATAADRPRFEAIPQGIALCDAALRKLGAGT